MPCIYTARVHVVVYADASIFSCRAKDCDDQSQRSSNWCVGQPNTIGLYVGHISWHLTATERDGDYTFGGCSQYGIQNIYIHPWWQHTHPHWHSDTESMTNVTPDRRICAIGRSRCAAWRSFDLRHHRPIAQRHRSTVARTSDCSTAQRDRPIAQIRRSRVTEIP